MKNLNSARLTKEIIQSEGIFKAKRNLFISTLKVLTRDNLQEGEILEEFGRELEARDAYFRAMIFVLAKNTNFN